VRVSRAHAREIKHPVVRGELGVAVGSEVCHAVLASQESSEIHAGAVVGVSGAAGVFEDDVSRSGGVFGDVGVVAAAIGLGAIAALFDAQAFRGSLGGVADHRPDVGRCDSAICGARNGSRAGFHRAGDHVGQRSLSDAQRPATVEVREVVGVRAGGQFVAGGLGGELGTVQRQTGSSSVADEDPRGGATTAVVCGQRLRRRVGA